MDRSSPAARLAAASLIASVLVAVAPAAGGQVPARPVRRLPWSPRLEVSVRTVPGVGATVDIEIRNASEEEVDVPIATTLFMVPPIQPDGTQPPASSTLSAAIDPLTGEGRDGSRSETPLKLPVRGSRRVRVNLEKVGWSLSPPLYVWVPRPLSQVAEYPEYDLALLVVAQGRPPEIVRSKPVRLRLRRP